LSEVIGIWAFIGTLYLLILTFQDIFNKMYVDDRFNYLMIGLTIALSSIGIRSIWYILALLAVVILIKWGFTKYKIVGAADVNTFMWIILGYGYIYVSSLVVFFLVFIGVLILYNIIKVILLKRLSIKTPFYIVILLSFIVTNIIMKYYY
jgi:hypothetical protein